MEGLDDSHTRDDGIVCGHAYTVLTAIEISGHRILRLRNPWGQGEWNGMYSDSDESTWNRNPDLKDALQLRVSDDGIFCMGYEDFKKVFSTVDVLPKRMKFTKRG